MEFTSLCSGSAGNCLYIAAGDSRVLVDGGCSCRYLEQSLALLALRPGQISALFITHEHSDHISGVARISRRFGIPVYAGERTWDKLPFGRDIPAELRFLCQGTVEIGQLTLDFFPLSHDAAEPLGLTARQQTANGQLCLGVVTDTGCITPAIVAAVSAADALVLESNHSVPLLQAGPYPAYLKRRILSARGHLSNIQAAELLLQSGARARTVLLAHLSSKNNDPRTALAEFTARLGEEEAQIERRIFVAPAHQPHPLIEVI